MSAKEYGRLVLGAMLEDAGWAPTKKQPKPPTRLVEQLGAALRTNRSTFERGAQWGLPPEETARRINEARWGGKVSDDDQ